MNLFPSLENCFKFSDWHYH